MGTWGTGPFCSDGAGEWFEGKIAAELLATINQTIGNRGEHGQRDYQPGRAAVRCALMLCADGIDRVPALVFQKARRVLELALGDDAYLSSWRGRTAIEAELREELLAVEAALTRHAEHERQSALRIRTPDKTPSEKPSLWPLSTPTRSCAGSSFGTAIRSPAGTPSASTTSAGERSRGRNRFAITCRKCALMRHRVRSLIR